MRSFVACFITVRLKPNIHNGHNDLARVFYKLFSLISTVMKQTEQYQGKPQSHGPLLSQQYGHHYRDGGCDQHPIHTVHTAFDVYVLCLGSPQTGSKTGLIAAQRLIELPRLYSQPLSLKRLCIVTGWSRPLILAPCFQGENREQSNKDSTQDNRRSLVNLQIRNH